MKRINIVLIYLLFFLQSGCKLSDRDLLAPPQEIRTEIPVKIAKWYNNYKGAISLNYDQGDPHLEHGLTVQQLIIKYNLTMDYELVTSNILQDSTLVKYIQDFMLPNGFGFFGHGLFHENYDARSYEECLEHFTKCYESMKTLGIKPVSFAYPGGWGYHLSTRKALKDAGFLCGRKYEQLDISDPYIVPDTIPEPRDWFALPTLVMQSIEYDGCVVCINNTEELLPYILETMNRRAWIILTYHSIGAENSYGFYKLNDFEKDLQAILKHNVWCDNMDNIVLYIYERKKAAAFAEMISDASGVPQEIRLTLSDGLENNYYNQALTLLLDIPSDWVNKELILKNGNSSEIFTPSTHTIHISIPPDETPRTLKVR